jgi:hypothetical protein
LIGDHRIDLGGDGGRWELAVAVAGVETAAQRLVEP